MRNIFLAAVAVGAVASIGMTATSAHARDYPFCIKGDFYDSPTGDCSFDTYQQCLATASGRRAYCDANPFFAYPKTRPVAHPKRQRGQY
jgi:hypothetical protein